jgi:hypothetical protein
VGPVSGAGGIAVGGGGVTAADNVGLLVGVNGSGVFVDSSSFATIWVAAGGTGVEVGGTTVAVAGRGVAVAVAGSRVGVDVAAMGRVPAPFDALAAVAVAGSSVGVIAVGVIDGGSGVVVGVRLGVGDAIGSNVESRMTRGSAVGCAVGVMLGVAVAAEAASRAVATSAFAASTYIVVARRKRMAPMTNSAAVRLVSASYHPHAW